MDINSTYLNLMNVYEAAEVLKCKPSTVCRLCRNTEIMAVNIGKGWSIPQNSLYHFINLFSHLKSFPFLRIEVLALKMKLYFFQRHFEIKRIFFLVPYQFLADEVIL